MKQRRMAARDRSPRARRGCAGDAGRRLVVHDADRLDRVRRGRRRAAPRSRRGSTPWRQSPGRNSTARPEPLGHLLPQRREVAGLGHQHAIARRQRVDERRFPRAGARGRVDDDGAVGLEHLLHPGEHRLAQRRRTPGPRWSIVGVVDRAQHAVGHVGRPGNLQEMAAGRTVVERNHGATLSGAAAAAAPSAARATTRTDATDYCRTPARGAAASPPHPLQSAAMLGASPRSRPGRRRTAARSRRRISSR